ncbi:unnamed protein product [Prunus armeniaca]
MSHPDNNASDNVNPTKNNEIEIDDHAPLWKYVKRLDKLGKGGGYTMFECNYCHNTYKGSYSRVKFHLLKMSGNGIAPCKKVTDEVFAERKKLVRECEHRLKSAAPRQVSLPNTGSLLCSSVSNVEQKKRKGMNGPLDRAFQNEAREQCNAKVARMFYTGGLSFHLARNPHYRNSYFRASTLPGYVPPGYNALRTTLSQQEKRHIERCLQPIKSTWSTKGVSVCNDGWTDSQRRPLINIMATCESGPTFLKGINCDGEYKDKHCIANFLIDSIKEIGYQNVVQVITDNAPVCRAAGLLVEARYPKILWTPCVVHTLNLALKSICSPKQNDDWYDKCSWISEIAANVGFIKFFIVNHNMRLTMYKDHCKLKLLFIDETRFASTLVMIRRFKEVKEGLEQMVISPNWSLYKEDDVGKAKVINLLFNELWDTMIEKVKAAIYRKEHKQLHEQSDFLNVVYHIILERLTKSSTPLHCLAHSLNPKFYSPEWLQEDPSRVAPHQDAKITRERKNCLEKYFSDDRARRDINVEYASFSMCLDDFGAIDAMNDRFHMEPMVWWIVHGSSTPNLQSIALKLLGKPCSSSCCERNWSAYSFIHSLRRNKLTPQRAEDMVFVHNNLRLLSRKSPSYKEGVTQMWDIGGDGFDNLGEEGVGMLEIANLSLDEPSLEVALFTGEDITNIVVD